MKAFIRKILVNLLIPANFGKIMNLNVSTSLSEFKSCY